MPTFTSELKWQPRLQIDHEGPLRVGQPFACILFHEVIGPPELLAAKYRPYADGYELQLFVEFSDPNGQQVDWIDNPNRIPGGYHVWTAGAMKTAELRFRLQAAIPGQHLVVVSAYCHRLGRGLIQQHQYELAIEP